MSTIVASSRYLPARKSKRRTRYTLFPNGEYRLVDKDFDRSVFNDPQSVPRNNVLASLAGVPESPFPTYSNASPNPIESIGEALLLAVPESLVAIASDSKGGLMGATITRYAKGLTAAVFRASLRSLPARCKQVVFVARRVPSPEVKEAATIAGECHLVKVIDIITIA